MNFWDSSALVPLLVQEDGGETVHRLLVEDEGLVVWLLTPVEIVSALWRRTRSGQLTSEEAGAALEGLDQLERAWTSVVDADLVQQRARRLLALHSLPAADALQLAAALVASDETPAALPFVTLDERLAEAARREGFRVLPV